MQKTKFIKAEEIIGLVSDELLDRLTIKTKVDYSVQKLHGKTVFKLFLYAFLNSKTISLRILEAIYKSEKFKNLFNVPNGIIKHSGIGMRLSKINYQYFENIFIHLIRSPKLDAILFAGKKILTSKIDSTMVVLSSKLLKVGMDSNTGKKSLKFTVEITQGIPVNLILFKEQKYLSEDKALPEIIKQKTIKKSLNIAIFDRGIQRKQSFVDFQNQNIYFISRINTQKIIVVKNLPLDKTDTPILTIISDQIVKFANSEKMETGATDTEFRVIVGKSKQDNKTISFITNVNFLTACEIAELYKSRWEIETFFKFIKQELNFKHLLSRTENGIKVVMYLTMIAAILLTIYKKVNNIIGWAVAKIRFMDELESGIMREWHSEMSPVFSVNNSFTFNSS
ncbi:MAG: IS4 family transposase [Patescibacteria group bacterium]